MTTEPQAQPLELKPCWCRSDTQYLRVKAHMDHGEFGCKERGLYVYCPNCWACGPTYNTDTEARDGWNRMRADLPRVAASNVAPPTSTYKNKRVLSDDERFRWRKFYNDYTFNNCDHRHGGHPRELLCAECAFELFAYLSTPWKPRAEREGEKP